MYHCESDIAIFVWRVTQNYAYIPFKFENKGVKWGKLLKFYLPHQILTFTREFQGTGPHVMLGGGGLIPLKLYKKEP